MSANFYYFISSLRYLRLGDEPPQTSEEFLGQCAYQLPPEQLQIVTDTCLEPGDAAPNCTIKRWSDFEIYLRNAVAQGRASRLKIEAQAFLKEEGDAFGGLEGQVQEALGRDPLAMEEQLDRIRWQFLDNISVGHDFDFQGLLIYRIKLLLLEKRAGLDAEKGQEELDRFLKEKLTNDQLPEFING